MKIVFETERLLLREMILDDAVFIFHLVNTEDWYTYIGNRNIDTIESAKAYIKKSYLGSYDHHGFGAYVMIRKEDNAKIGTCGLYKRPNLDHPDIGFALLPQFYKKGYALEAANEMMNYAKQTLGFQTVLAITLPKNVASKKLLNKIGLKQIDVFCAEGDDEELLLFSN